MIIASFNVNSIRTRLPIVSDWLTDHTPDILCVQETKVQDEQFPSEDFLKLGYSSYFKGEKSYNGIAVFSKIPFDEVTFGFDGKGAEDGTRLACARKGDLVIVNTYVPQGTAPDSDRFQYKLEWFSRLKKLFAAQQKKGRSVIWVGDFNVAPLSIDVHNPKRLLGSVGYHPDEHKALASVVELGFVDIFRKHVPGPNEYTFWDYRAKDALSKGLGWRVDHIWALGPVSEKSVRAWIDRSPRMKERPSDHTVIAAEFDL